MLDAPGFSSWSRVFQLSSFTHAGPRELFIYFSPQLCAPASRTPYFFTFSIVEPFELLYLCPQVVAMAFLLAALFVIESAALEVARSSCRGGQVPWPTGPTGCEEMGPAKERAMKFLEENMPPWDVINKGTLKPGVRIQLRCC